MRKKYTFLVLAAMIVALTVTSVYAISWYQIYKWANRYVPYDYCNYYTFDNLHATYQRIRLKPLSGDPDLYVWGRANGLWYQVGSSLHGGLTQEVVRVPRGTYTKYRVCVYGYTSAYYNLFYEGGV